MNRLLASGEEVYWLKQPSPRPALWAWHDIHSCKASTLPKLQKLADEVGLNFDGVASRPTGEAYKLRPMRIGLWDRYGGSMPSGWVRWLLEQYEFPFTVVYPPTLDAGDLASKFDVLIFVDGGSRLATAEVRVEEVAGGFGGPIDPQSIPAEFRDRLGTVTVARDRSTVASVP